MKLSNSGENGYSGNGSNDDIRVTVALPRAETHRTTHRETHQDFPPSPPSFAAFEVDKEFERKKLIEHEIIPRGSYALAYVGVFVFIFLLYLRPNELFPFIGGFPIIKIITILVVGIYLVSRLATGEKTLLTLEAKMMITITGLAILFAPIAANPGEAIGMLNSIYIKIVVIFILMTNLLDTRQRVLKIWMMVAAFGAWLSFLGLKSYVSGEFGKGGRIANSVGGMFGNPNDLATSIDLLLPIAVVMAIMSGKIMRLFYIGCIGMMLVGMVVTQSRGGFIGLVITATYMTFKLSKGRRIIIILLLIFISFYSVVLMPEQYSSKYVDRIETIFDIEKDATGSAQERRELFYRTIDTFFRRPFTGVGMGNLHIYSIHELGAHNAYLEIAAELGIFGLAAYLVLIGSAYSGIHRIEKRIKSSTTKEDKQLFYMCVGLKAVIIAYLTCSLFASVQYQWFIYLPAAYAVAVRRIDEAEREEQGLTAKKRIVSGTLIKVTTRLKAIVFDKGKKQATLFPPNKQGKGLLIK